MIHNIKSDDLQSSIICRESKQKHYIIRVGDGKNFKNSKYPFWGFKKCHLSFIKKFKEGDILWFLTSKSYGGIFIGVAEYTCYYDRNNEPLIQIHSYSNKEQNWEGDDDWSIQIHYKDLYKTEKQNIKAVIQGAAVIFNYETIKNKIQDNLYEHYSNFIYYAEPKIF